MEVSVSIRSFDRFQPGRRDIRRLSIPPQGQMVQYHTKGRQLALIPVDWDSAGSHLMFQHTQVELFRHCGCRPSLFHLLPVFSHDGFHRSEQLESNHSRMILGPLDHPGLRYAVVASFSDAKN